MDRTLSVAFAEHFSVSREPGQIIAGEVPAPSNPI
jgi:hypothetical protein